MNQSQCEQLRSTAVNRRHAGDFAQDNPEWEVQTHTAIVGRPALKVNSVFGGVKLPMRPCFVAENRRQSHVLREHKLCLAQDLLQDAAFIGWAD